MFSWIKTRLERGKLIHTLGAFIFFLPRPFPSPVTSNNVEYSKYSDKNCHLLVIWAIIAAIINPNERGLQTRMLSSHRLDNDWVGIIQKSPILYRSFKLRMFFLLWAPGDWVLERREVRADGDGRGKTETFLIRRHQTSCPLRDPSRSLFHVNIQQTITGKKSKSLSNKNIFIFGVKNEGRLWG